MIDQPSTEISPRVKLLRTFLSKDRLGLEIGPSHAPIAPKADGYNVHIIDHCSKEALISKYTGHDVDLQRIEDVDFLWAGEPYKDLTGRPGGYQWVIASHVIEHVPDLIAFFKNCSEVLADDGLLVLAVPDKRYCFDYYRPVSGLGKVIDAHLLNLSRHSPGTITEHCINFAKLHGLGAWGPEYEGTPICVHSYEQASEIYRTALEETQYTDCHSWCFTPATFRLILLDLLQLGFIDLHEHSFPEPSGCEFYAVLSRTSTSSTMPVRAELVKMVSGEPTDVDQKTRLLSKTIATLKTQLEKEQKRTSALRKAIAHWNSQTWVTRALHKLRVKP